MKPTGLSLIALAILFNLPFARLAATFNYPDILRQPTETILAAFTAGGPALIATWYAFALSALLMIPVALAHAFTRNRLTTAPELAISAALIGTLAGLLQAMGLLRWVLVVPGLAATGDTQGFALIHAYAGMGLGEHLGMLLTAFHVALIAQIQQREGTRLLAATGAITTLLIALGGMEGPALALGLNGTAFGLAAIAGYLCLSLWLVLSGLSLLRQAPAQRPALA
jgi:hypothetical protein